MGYYTQYRLEVQGATPEQLLAIKEEKTVYGSLMSMFGFALADPSSDIKWYEHDRDMTNLSLQYPTVLFILDGDGEETEDLWRKFFKNGHIEEHRASQWVPPPEPWNRNFGT